MTQLAVNYEGYDPFPTLPGIGGVEVDNNIVLDSNSLALTGVRISNGISAVECEIFNDDEHAPGRTITIYPLDGKNRPLEEICVNTGDFDVFDEDVLKSVVKSAFFIASEQNR